MSTQPPDEDHIYARIWAHSSPEFLNKANCKK